MAEKIPEIFFYPDRNHAGVPIIAAQLRSIEPISSPWPCIVCGSADVCGTRSTTQEILGQQEMALRLVLDVINRESRPISISDMQEICQNWFLQEPKVK